MQYEVIKAADLDALNKAVSEHLKLGWKLKNNVIEYIGGFAQELVRSPMECVGRTNQVRKPRKQKSWIDLDFSAS